MKNNWILGVVAVLFISATAAWHLSCGKIGLACFMFYMAGIDTYCTFSLYLSEKRFAESEERWRKLLVELEERNTDVIAPEE